MRIRQLLFAACLSLGAVVQAVAAELALEQVLEAARSNLDVARAARTLQAAQADIAAADRAPLPVLSAKLAEMDLQHGLGPGNVVTRKRIDKSIGIDWTWERGNKRLLRTQAARFDAEAARLDVDDVRIGSLLAAQAAFFDALAAQERIEQVSQIERGAAQLAATAGRRQQAGDLSVQDATRSEIEAQRARAEIETARLDLQRAVLALAQATGLRFGAEPLTVRPDWPALDVVVPQALPDALVEDRPDVRAARSRVQAAQAALEAARALRRNDVTWGASIDHFPGTSTRQLELRMQVPLQWGYSYEGEIGRAQAELGMAQDLLDKTRLVASSELERLRSEAIVAARRARSYETDIVPRARRVAEAAEMAFGKGAMTLTDLLDARRTLRATLLEALLARTEHAKAALAWRLRSEPYGLAPPATAPPNR